MSETADEALGRQRFIRMLDLISAGSGHCCGCGQVAERFVKRKAQSGDRSPRCLDCWRDER
jgi:hypothetical protein